MNEIIKPVGQWISENVPWTVLIVIFIFCLLFEISKVKIYPLKWLWKLICLPFKKINEKRTNSIKNLLANMEKNIDNKITSLTDFQNKNCQQLKKEFEEMTKRFDKLDLQQKEAEERLDQLAAARIKNHVLNFARQCRKGEPHSHEDFANLFREHQEYEALVAKYTAMDDVHKKAWENNVYKHDYEYINRVYDECNNKGDFLE